MNDREAFKSALRQSCRNIPFFAAQAYLVSFLPSVLGVVGTVIATISALLFIVFVAWDLFTTLLGIVLLITWSFRPAIRHAQAQLGWMAAGTLLTAFSATAYAAMFYWAGRSTGWWGFGAFPM
jgi:hypothetical protein